MRKGYPQQMSLQKWKLHLQMRLYEAADVHFPGHGCRRLSFAFWKRALGKFAAEFVYLYPPGIPIVVPGEQITGLFTRNVRRYMEQGLNLHGLCGENNESICVVKEQAEV
ncbi:MAG: hypothetical protein ACLU6Y_08255 [Ruminococcus sp.]